MRILVLLLCLGLSGAALAQAPSPQAAPPPAPITFTLVEGGPDACGPGCSRWIAAEGAVLPGSVVAFADFLKQLGPDRPPLAIHSPGGMLDVMLALGRMVRREGLETVVARTDRSGSVPALALDGQCFGACFYLLAAGVRRSAAPGATISISPVDFRHPAGGELPDAVRTRMIASTLVKVRAYLAEMDVDPALADYLDGERYEPFYPARGMLETYGLITHDPAN